MGFFGYATPVGVTHPIQNIGGNDSRLNNLFDHRSGKLSYGPTPFYTAQGFDKRIVLAAGPPYYNHVQLHTPVDLCWPHRIHEPCSIYTAQGFDIKRIVLAAGNICTMDCFDSVCPILHRPKLWHKELF